MVTLASGALIRFADHQNFSDIGQGLWSAVQTVTTVGYGGLVPSATLGRLVGRVRLVIASDGHAGCSLRHTYSQTITLTAHSRSLAA